MPTESREQRNQAFDNNYGEMAASTATDHLVSNGTQRRHSRTPSRSSTNVYGTAPSAPVDHLNSNATSLRRIRTSTSFRLGENSSPPSASSGRQSSERRVKNVATLHTELSNHSTRGSELDRQKSDSTILGLNSFMDRNTESWVNSLRQLTAAKGRGTPSRKLGHHEKVIETPAASMSSGEDKDSLKYMDEESLTKSHKYEDPGGLISSNYVDPRVDSRPSTSDGTRPTGQNTLNGSRRSSSTSRRDGIKVSLNHGGDTSPPPNHHQRVLDSRPKLSTPSTSNKLQRSESMGHQRSSGMEYSKTTAVTENGSHRSTVIPRADNFTSQLNHARGPRSGTPTMPNNRVQRSESMRHQRSSGMDSSRTIVEDDGSHRSTLVSRTEDFTARSNRDRGLSPTPNRRLIPSHSHPISSATPTSNSTQRSRSMRHQRSNGMDPSRTTVEENGSHRSTLVSRTEDSTTQSNRDRGSSPAPNRRLGPSNSHPELSHSTTFNKRKPHNESVPLTRSMSMDSRPSSRTGEWIRTSQGRDRTNLNSKAEDARESSPSSRTALRTKPSSNKSHNLEKLLQSAESNNVSLREQYEGKARSTSTENWKTKPLVEPSHALRALARPADSNGTLQDRDDVTIADFQKPPSEGSTSRRFRREHESDYKSSSRRRTSTSEKILKEIDASHFVVTRHGSTRSSEQFNYLGSSRREGSTTPWKRDASKRLYPRKSHATTDVSLAQLPLNKVAAASYKGGSLPFNEMVPFPHDVADLNKYLDDCKRDVEAAVPGKILIGVLGHENSDLDSIVSTITYAYLLSRKGNDELHCFAPMINMREEDFVLHTDAAWLFKVTGIDTSSFIFVDQISLLYYHKFGFLNLVLVDHSRLAPHQENLQEAVIAILDHNTPESLYPWVSDVEIEQVGSCCTLIAEKYLKEAPEHLIGRGISRLLLGAILLDTANLDSKFSRFSTRDEQMAAFLIHGAGRYGLQGLFRHLRKMKFDISMLDTKDVLRKDLKRWTLGPGKTDIHGCRGMPIPAAMSTLGVPLVELLSRKHIMHDLKLFRRRMKLGLLFVMTGYFDVCDRYHREILVVPQDMKLTEQIVTCFSERKDELLLSSLRIGAFPEEMLIYKQGQVTASRKVIREILLDHFAQ